MIFFRLMAPFFGRMGRTMVLSLQNRAGSDTPGTNSCALPQFNYASNTDPLSIIHTLKQLIFRQNQQEFRNFKYKEKDQKKVDLRGLVGNTSTEPINIDLTKDTFDDVLDPAIRYYAPH
jgi:hypothetical protein